MIGSKNKKRITGCTGRCWMCNLDGSKKSSQKIKGTYRTSLRNKKYLEYNYF